MGIESRGFASFSAKKLHACASKGGKTAHRLKTAHQWTPEEAKEAGRKGGRTKQARKSDIRPCEHCGEPDPEQNHYDAWTDHGDVDGPDGWICAEVSGSREKWSQWQSRQANKAARMAQDARKLSKP